MRLMLVFSASQSAATLIKLTLDLEVLQWNSFREFTCSKGDALVGKDSTRLIAVNSPVADGLFSCAMRPHRGPS